MAISPVTPTPTERAKQSRLINRDFSLLWSGQVVTDLGTAVFTTALIVWVAGVLAPGQPWAPLAVSGLLVAQSLPILLVRPLAGVFVDRWDARRTMLRMDAVRTALIALLLIPVALSVSPLWQLVASYIVVLLTSACGQFFNTALLALINDLVPRDDLPRASGLSEATWSTASVLGPPLAAPLVLGLGLQWALVLNAVSFAGSYLTLRSIRSSRSSRSSPLAHLAARDGDMPVGGAGGQQGVPIRDTGERSRVVRDLRDGLRFVLANHTVRTVTLAVAIAMLGAGILHTLDYFFFTQSLHAAPALYGLVSPAFGGGSLVGALVAGRMMPRLGIARTFVVSLLGVGLAILVLSRQMSLVPALAVWVVFGVVNAATNVALMPLLLAATPHQFVGRMNALFFTIITASSLCSSTLAGWLDSDVLRGFSATLLGMRFGPVDTLLALTGLLICAGGICAGVGLRRSRVAEPNR